MDQQQTCLLPTNALLLIRKCETCANCSENEKGICFKCGNAALDQFVQVAYCFTLIEKTVYSRMVYICVKCREPRGMLIEPVIVDAIFEIFQKIGEAKVRGNTLHQHLTNIAICFHQNQQMHFKKASKLGSRACKRCNTESTKTMHCSGCWLTRYCSETCSKADWKRHKEECKLFQKSNYFMNPVKME